MFSEGLFNFLTFILSSSAQPQKFLVFVAAILVVNVLMAVIDWKWGRGIGFTVLALLAGAFYVYSSLVFLQEMRQSLEMELAEPQGRLYLGISIGMIFWYILELPIIFSLGVGAVILAALSRQRGWIIGNAIALALIVVAPLLATWIIRSLDAGTNIFTPLAIYERDVRDFQAHLAFVVALFAVQFLYLAYGVWRIWRSREWGSRSRSATSLPSVQS